MKRSTLFVFFAVLVAVAAAWAPYVHSFNGYFSSQGCNAVNCHVGQTTSSNECGMCHAHGVHSSSAKNDINVTGTTDKATYAPGETVNVTVDGGYRATAARAILYNDNGVMLDTSTGTGNPPINAAAWPVALGAPAPTTPGTYTWVVAWYGHEFDIGGAAFGAPGTSWIVDLSNANHGEERVSTNSFTVTGTDTTPPTLASTSPVDNAVDVAVSTLVTVTFSEAIDNTTVDGTSFFVSDGVDNVAGTVSVSPDNTMATFTSSALLADNTVHTATLTTDVTDLAGNPLADNVVWSFTTGTGTDTIGPTVLSTVPADGATGVTVTTVVAATFDEAIDPVTVDNTSFFVTDGVDNVVGAISFSDNTVTFTPSANLAVNTVYTATLTTDVTDASGNPLADNIVWSFTTAVPPPPGDGGGCSVTGAGSRWDNGAVIALLGLLAMLVALRFRRKKDKR